MLSQMYVDDTNRMVDMVAVAESCGSELTRFGSDYRGTCPIHKGSDQTSFSIYKGKDGNYHWRCFSTCDAGGDGIQLYMALYGMQFKEAVSAIRGDTPYVAETAKIMAEKHEIDRALADEAEREKYKQHLVEYTRTNKHKTWRDNPEPWVVEEWNKRGVFGVRRLYYGFGGCSDYRIGDSTYRTLTIPIWDYGYNMVNVRHRILSDDVAGRYRPDVAGIPAAPFMAHPYLGFHEAHTNIIVEGEIKAAVVSDLFNDTELQVIGVPGKSMYNKIAAELVGKNNIVIPDPDAVAEAKEFAIKIKAKMVQLPMKVDDFIIQKRISKEVMQQFIRGGRIPWN